MLRKENEATVNPFVYYLSLVRSSSIDSTVFFSSSCPQQRDLKIKVYKIYRTCRYCMQWRNEHFLFVPIFSDHGFLGT